jgi:Brp/Blh family beta-carotene 15,15'-monooxygenase
MVFLAGLGAMTLVQAGLALGQWGQLMILAPAVALLGLPHGALDLPMAETLWPLRGWRQKAVFFAGYLGLAAAVGLLWWMAPGVGLAAFLAYSAFHFSGDWQQDGPPWRVAGGLSAIGAPVVFHLPEVTAIFAALGAAAWAPAIAQGAALAGLAGAVCAVFLVASQPRRGPVLEIAAIWIGAAWLPPLLAFVVYFCLLHSLRHLTATLAALPDRRRAWRDAAGIIGVSVLAAGLGLAVLVAGAGGEVEASLLQVVFIGLAALTVPHMVLVDRFTQQTTAADRPCG